jgi:uncharacterized protein (DUF4415 family)
MKREYDFRQAKRATFRGLPPKEDRARHTKVRITMFVDQDVLQFFKAQAANPGAAPYQTQINRALREYVFGRGAPAGRYLLSDEGFISRLAERVSRYGAGQKRSAPKAGKTRTP